MKHSFNKDKMLTIGILPIMWLIYFLFEIFSGRVKDLYTLILNLSLVLVFAFAGWIIYKCSIKNLSGVNTKVLITTFVILMLLDQGLKLIIKFNFFDAYFEIIPSFLSFNPIINTQGSWLNARFNFNVSFPLLILINGISLMLFIEIYRYSKYRGFKSFWSDMCFIFIFAGALCSFIDKVFYGGSLDFIGISDLFIADFKDIYINLGLLFFIMACYKSGFFSEQEETTLKDDLNSIKKFIKFIKKDILKILKREKV
ncbi:signal peptidase II [Clostridioides difficile]